MTQLVDTEILQATSTAQDPYVFKSAKDLPDCDIDGWEVQSQSCQDQFRSKRWLQCRCCSMQSEYEACRNLGYRLIRKLGKSNKDTDFEFTYMTEWQFDLLQIRRKITPINQSPPSLQPKAIPPLHLHEYQSLYLLLMHYCKKDLVELFADEYGFLERHRDNIYFRPTAAGLRQACDICSTTIINCFWICSGCAMEICLDCYKDALNGTVQKEQLREFEFCCKDFRHSYYESAEQSLRKFVPAFKIPSILFLYLWDKFRYAYERLPTHFANRLFYFQVDAGKFLDVHYTQINITNFHQYWSRGIPVVVRDLGKLLRRGQWSPQTLLDLYKNTPATILDQNNNPVEVGVEDFFQGMMDSQRRPKTFNGHYRRHLKLKDWPPRTDFDRQFPELFTDFMRILPLPEYTCGTGPFNLARFMPQDGVPPDLGPKMYNAYASNDEGPRGFGTTNLHNDMADAVNIMMFAGDRPEDMDDTGYEDDKIPGALWCIYPDDQSENIRNYLKEVASSRSLEIDDPIHDQCFYLTRPMRKKLSNSSPSSRPPYVIEQNPGDAVFVPAGCPHQVCNLRPSIKIAMDFVSPERLNHSIRMTKEFRQLTAGHSRRVDILQSRNVLLHTLAMLFHTPLAYKADGSDFF